MQSSLKRNGFTIVELLIVIVVIGILAAITIVAYSGIQDRAKVATLQNDLVQASKQLEVYKLGANSSEQYPLDLATANLKTSAGTIYAYSVNNNSSPGVYCLDATSANRTYFITPSTSKPTSGTCTGIVGWWKLNGNAFDSSGNSSNGTVNGATLSTGQNGQSNSAYVFNGTSDYIGVSPTLTFPLAAGTISTWTKLSNNAGLPQNIVFYGSAVEDGCTGAPAIVLSTCGFVLQNSTSAIGVAVPSITDNQWHNLVGVWDAGANFANVYLDGVLATASGLSFVPSVAQQTTTIGKPGANSRYTLGSVDDVRIYNRALSAYEISAIYTGGAQ